MLFCFIVKFWPSWIHWSFCLSGGFSFNFSGSSNLKKCWAKVTEFSLLFFFLVPWSLGDTFWLNSFLKQIWGWVGNNFQKVVVQILYVVLAVSNFGIPIQANFFQLKKGFVDFKLSLISEDRYAGCWLLSYLKQKFRIGLFQKCGGQKWQRWPKSRSKI